MYLKDGIVYGEQQVPSLKISEVVFEPLKDPDVYLHPNIEYGILTWKNGEIDCAPEYLYNHSYEYTMMVV